jgi:hypothetical protein
MFFECPITKSYRPKLESTRLGLLSVTGGELSIPAIIAQLQRLVPVENFSWECRQVDHNVFKVTFPDREEIERLARFGTFQVPNSRIQLTFEQCVTSMEPTSKLPDIWILMSGIPQRRIGDFLAMWSLGTLFGKTLKVDMKYTRDKGVLRMLVGCLDFRRIPAKERIFIANGFYDISFEVEVQRDLEMVAAANPGEEPSDNDGHGNNGDSTSKSPKNQDAMDTDSTLNLQDQEGANHSSTSGPDINKLAGEFSSGVKFSPRVKLMMEQSRLEISALIKSLSYSAAAAENSVETAAATTPAPVVAAAVAGAVSATEAASPAAARPASGDVQSRIVRAAEAPAAGAGNAQDAAAVSPIAAVEFGSADDAAVCSAATTLSAADAFISVGPVFDINARASPAVASRAPSPVSATSTPPSRGGTPAPASPSAEVDAAAVGDTPTNSQKNSFRISSESAGEVLRGSKTTCAAIYTTEEAAQLPPSERAIGGGYLEVSTSAPPQCEKRAPLINTSPRIAVAPFSPSTPSRKIEDVIAFGGIREEIASPIRSSQRVRMQPNGDATQLERATQLAEKRFHALTPGTKSNLSFSKFSDHEIVARATTLGVSLGSNMSEIE